MKYLFRLSRLVILLLGLSMLIQCNGIHTEEIEREDDYEEELSQTSDSLRNYYQNLRYQKSYYYEKLGTCESIENPSDYGFDREPGRVVFTQLMDGEAQFKLTIYADCCQEFGIDYQIKGDTLHFFYEPMGTEVCECKCLYSYKLRLKESLKPTTNYLIIPKT